MKKENQWHDVEVDVVVTYKIHAVWGPSKEDAVARVKRMIIETLHTQGEVVNENEDYNRVEVVRSYTK